MAETGRATVCTEAPSAKRDALMEAVYQAVSEARPELRDSIGRLHKQYSSTQAWRRGAQDHRVAIEAMGHIGRASGSSSIRHRSQRVVECRR